MEIKARQKDDIIILDLSGRIDINAANFVEVIGQCIRDGYPNILCNFEEVDFIDYMGISAIALAYKEIANNRGRMNFFNVPTHLRGFFSVSGLDRVIDIYPDEGSALNSFKEDKIIDDIKKMQLRRRFKRLPIDIKIELKSNSKRNPICINADILNLSGVGAFIFGCPEFNLGDEVILRMKLPPKQDEIEIEAKVVWLADKQIQPHFYPGMGVEFSHIPGPTQQKLIQFIERNLSSMASDY